VLLAVVWIVPVVLLWWMARTLNAIRLDVQYVTDDVTDRLDH